MAETTPSRPPGDRLGTVVVPEQLGDQRMSPAKIGINPITIITIITIIIIIIIIIKIPRIIMNYQWEFKDPKLKVR